MGKGTGGNEEGERVGRKRKEEYLDVLIDMGEKVGRTGSELIHVGYRKVCWMFVMLL